MSKAPMWVASLEHSPTGGPSPQLPVKGTRLPVGPGTAESSVPKLFSAKSAESENGHEIG